MTFRAGFIAGAVVAVIAGAWCFLLWQPEQQVALHSEHLMRAIEAKGWSRVEQALAVDYEDQWGQDRATALSRLRQVLSYSRNTRVEVSGAVIRVAEREGSWRARITFTAEPNEITDLIRTRVNALEEPFELGWRRQSWKPWDWKLVRVGNPGLEIPTY
jgi:hypothetical protein